MKSSRDLLLPFVVFTAGATVMATEMGASRLLAPYFGDSLIIWANLIGMILIYLTLGYALGGRFADRYPYKSALYKLTAWSGFLIILVPILSRPLLRWSTEGFAELSAGIFFGSLFSILLLFALPVTMLGAVSPYAMRVKIESISEAGHTAGYLYAISTLGSIFGTFVPVLLLQPWIGTTRSIWIFGFILLAVSLLGLAKELGRKSIPYAVMLALSIFLMVLFDTSRIKAAEMGQLLYEGESMYNYIQVVREDNGWVDLILNEGHATHSRYNPNQILTGGPWDYFMLAPLFRPEGLDTPVRDALMIGLAAGTMPRQYSIVYPDTHIDGVEIDGRIVEVGRKYFDMNEPQLNVIVDDGRYFLRRTDKKYDIIAIDAYRQPYIPFHLTTHEFFEEVRQHLKPNGIVVINAGRAPGDYRLVNALASTMKSVYPNVFAIDTAAYLNTLIYATNQPMTIQQFWNNAEKVRDPYLTTILEWVRSSGNIRELSMTERPFTDDWAPVERVIDQMIYKYAITQGKE